MEKMILNKDGFRVILRTISQEDTENIIRWRNNEEVRKWFIDRRLFTKENHEYWLKEFVEKNKVYQFIINVPEVGKDIGSVYLRDIDEENRKAQFGIFIGENQYRSAGYGQQAAQLILKFGFDNLKLHKIWLKVLSDNKVAKSSYERAGFVQEGCFKDDIFVDGIYHDVIYMSCIK